MRRYLDVDPRTLRVLGQTPSGANPTKLHRQIALYGRSHVGMPPLEVHEGPDGLLVIFDGLTRATRLAKLSPGTLVRVEVTDREPRSVANLPTVADLLP